MRRVLLFILFLFSFPLFSQTFSLTDDVVTNGDTYTSWDINFELGKENIYLDISQPTLDSLTDFLMFHPKLKIEIGVHTDFRWKQHYNIALSKSRAEEIKKYFVSQGVDASRMVTKGYGSTKYIYSKEQEDKDNQNYHCNAPPKHEKGNRRVTITILEN